MLSFIALCVILAVGHLFRMKIRLLRQLYLPSCVIGGLFALALIQGAKGCQSLWPNEWLAYVNDSFTLWSQPWAKLPGFLINIVFACLFLGIRLPGISQLWHRAKFQVAYGQIVAWGQYVVGIGLWLILLQWFYPDLPEMFAGILPVGFEGGHGTAAGLSEVFQQYGWADGKDFALTSATFGILGAITVGMILINWAARNGYTVRKTNPDDIEEDDSISVIPVDRRPIAGKLTVHSDAIESFSLHVAIVGLACLIGYLIKQLLLGIESCIPCLDEFGLFRGFPLFPLCMLGGLIIQIYEERFDRHDLIDVGLTRRIQNSALDFLVVSAIATINLDVVVKGIVPLLILVAAGVLWNIGCLTLLARRILPDAWFERAIAEMGQSMGVTATGLLLLRVVDPDYDSPAADAFACKQLIHEPFMGGGLWTGAAIPLIATIGALPVFAIAVIVMSIWLAIVFLPRLLRGKG